MDVRLLRAISEVGAADWNGLVGNAYPFLRHEFLAALEESGAVSAQTGWQPMHLVMVVDGQAVALMPLYLKYHSRGEYVFDRAWAEAFRQHGLNYYPKFLTAIPFTPCVGPRFVCADPSRAAALAALALAAIRQVAEEHGISSWHGLFAEPEQLALWRDLPLSFREDVQFQWFNRDYQDFDGFLAALTASKRKMVKRERRRVAEQGITLETLPGGAISDSQWRQFYQFYALTYLKKASQPYLNLAFFQQLAKTMPEQLRLVLAFKAGTAVAAALSFVGADTLYGRYWGCAEEFDALHFEACYYQGIDFCIAQGLARFDSGAQGEHKIARGFTPISTVSAHWLKDTGFAQAVANFVQDERLAVAAYKADAARYLPFKNHTGAGC